MIINNIRYDRRTYICVDDCCETCKLSLYDKLFGVDPQGQPFYFHALTQDTAVMFCSPQHSSEWALLNSDKIWNRKTQ